MGKIKNKTRNEIEYLQGIIRQLKKENSILQRDVSKIKRLAEKNYTEKQPPETKKHISNPDLCPDCGKGKCSFLELKNAIYMLCPLCGFRQKLINYDEKKK